MHFDVSQVIDHVRHSPFMKSCIIELLRASATFLFGFISFCLYQRYKNKKDNNKLYIQFLKLEKEMINNKDIIDETLDKYISLEVLSEQFYIEGNLDNNLLDFYSSVNQLNLYSEQHMDYDEHGVPEGMETIYTKHPYDTIRECEVQIEYLTEEYHGNYDEIKDYEEQVEYLKTKNIFIDLAEIEAKAEALINKEFELSPAITYIHTRLSKYNKLEEKEKEKYLTRFCTMILHEENDFADSLSNYNKMIDFKKTLDNKSSAKKLDIKFSSWGEIDIDLLAVYNAELYLQLEDLYKELNSLEIYKNRKETLEKAKNTIVKKLEPIINKDKKRLKKVLLKTNKMFKSV